MINLIVILLYYTAKNMWTPMSSFGKRLLQNWKHTWVALYAVALRFPFSGNKEDNLNLFYHNNAPVDRKAGAKELEWPEQIPDLNLTEHC